MAPKDHPVIVVVPGAAQSPSHYAHLLHLLHTKGYATLSALLPSTGNNAQITADDDKNYIRERMILPVLDVENHNVVIVTHSYSGMPGSAAVRGLGKSERLSQGKRTFVLGQIHIATIINKGGEGQDLFGTFGGQVPPHINIDRENNMLRCPEPIQPLYTDVDEEMAAVAVTSCMNPAYSSWSTPCPPASWADADFKGRTAYIRTVQDQCVPYDVQKQLLDGTGVDWIIKDIDTAHSPQLSQPEKLLEIVLGLVASWET